MAQRLETFKGVVSEEIFLACCSAPVVVVIGATSTSRVIAVPSASALSPSVLLAPSSEFVSELVLLIGEVAESGGCEGADKGLHPHRPNSVEEVART